MATMSVEIRDEVVACIPSLRAHLHTAKCLAIWP